MLKGTIRLRWVWGLATILALVLVVAYLLVRPLPLPCPKTGQVVDAETGAPVADAVLEYKWTLYDYPMLGGAGSYQIRGTTTSDGNGRFTLSVPSHRRGVWDTEMYPPMVRAKGYHPFTLSDWPASVRYQQGEVIILMKPLKAGSAN